VSFPTSQNRCREDYDPDEDEGLDHEFGGDPDHYAGMNYAPEREVEAEESANLSTCR
jgi:hypothetical protein